MLARIGLQEYLKELDRWQIRYEVKEWSITLTGGDNKARWHYEQMLSADKDIQSQIILYAANKDTNLRDLIEERAAIRWADGLLGDLLSAVKCNLRGDKE